MSWFRRKNEPDLENAFPLGRSGYVSPPPQGGDATIPVMRRGQRNDALIGLMKLIEREIYMRSTEVSSSDTNYCEPVATYPLMEQTET